MATIAYRYRIRRVASDEERIFNEIRSGHNLYNDLVAIERERRWETQRFWAKRGGYLTELQALEAAIDLARDMPKGEGKRAAWKTISEQREAIWDKERSAIAEIDASDPVRVRRKARAKELRAEAKARGEKFSAKDLAAILDSEPDCVTERDRLRLQLVQGYKDRGIKPSAKMIAARLREAGHVGPTEHIEAKARDAAYRAYIARGVTPGTRGVIADAHAKSLEKLGLRDQRFKRWDGSGAFGVQIHGGATPEELFGGQHTMAQLKQLPPSPLQTPGSRCYGCLNRLRVRIGSEGKRRVPIWAEFDAIVSRPLPPEAHIMQVRIVVERVGVMDKWHAVFTCQVPDELSRVDRPADPGGTVAVDIGWRSMGDGELRVGYWADDRGNHGGILPPSIRGRNRGRGGRRRPKYDRTERPYRHALEHVRSIQSILSEQFDRVLEELCEWLKGHKAELPEWLVGASIGIHQWRSQPRLNHLVERWLDNRFEGDSEIVDLLDAWRRRWRHLYGLAASEREHIIAARNIEYERWAQKFARRYDTIIVNAANLAETRKRKTKKQAAPDLVMVEDAKRSQAFDVAPGELRKQATRYAQKYGRLLAPQAFDTMKCHACGQICEFDRARHLTHECEHCGEIWDQDHNACRNALRERLGGGHDSGGARKPDKRADSNENTTEDAAVTQGIAQA